MPCPNDETLVAMVERSLDPARFGELELHLDSCPHCRKMVAALALGSRPANEVPAVPFAELGLAPNTVIHDRYAVGAELGHGGMGTVYLAHDRSLGRDVALKLHRAGSGGDRLQREAFAMAKLAHPNVVNVFEVAAYDDRIFVAMEYVRGGTLRSWLAAAPRRWRDTVAMLVEAGRGLAAAHAAGLVHRDFKPENILVGEDGRPLVGDFGLARTDHTAVPTDPDALAVALTVTGGVAGTPAYMAPEQLDGAEVDARSDQFAFCIVAWEALYGKRPFAGTTLSALHEAITAHQLERPDSHVPDRVRRVIERGLENNPAKRFPDMTALLAALREAATPRTTRNAIATGVAALAVAGGAYAVFTTIAARERAAQCDLAGDRVRAQWSPITRAALLTGFLATNRPTAGDSFARAATTFDRYTGLLADQAVAVCRDRFESAHELAARTSCLATRRDELGAVVGNLLRVDANIVMRAPDIAWSLFDPAPCTGPSALDSLPLAAADSARVAQLKATFDTGDFKAGIAMGQPLVAEAHARKDQPFELAVAGLMGQIQAELDPKASVASFNEAEQLAEALGRDLDAANALDSLARSAGTETHERELAHRQIALARAKLARIGGNTALESHLAFTEAQILSDESRVAEALTSMHTAVELMEKAYGPEHPTVGAAYGTLAQILRQAGQLDQADIAAHRAIAILTATLGTEHPDVAGAKLNLATLLIEEHHPDEARALLQEVDATTVRVYGEITPNRAAIQGNLGTLALSEKRWTDAVIAFTRARDILAAVGGPDALMIAGPERDLSVAYGAQNKLDEALAHANRAVAIIEKAGPDGEPRLPGALEDLCEVQIARDKPGECVPLAEKAVALIEARGPDADPTELGDGRYLLARAMWDAKRDRPAARALATRAQAEHPIAERQQVIAAWLRAHPL